MERTFGQVAFAFIKHDVYALAASCANRHNGIKVKCGSVCGNGGGDVSLVHCINFVDDKNGRHLCFAQTLNERLFLRTDGCNGLHHQHSRVHA